MHEFTTDTDMDTVSVFRLCRALSKFVVLLLSMPHTLTTKPNRFDVKYWL
jgi:hypothetical protein